MIRRIAQATVTASGVIVPVAALCSFAFLHYAAAYLLLCGAGVWFICMAALYDWLRPPEAPRRAEPAREDFYRQAVERARRELGDADAEWKARLEREIASARAEGRSIANWVREEIDR